MSRLAEEYRLLLERLGDDVLRSGAILRMEGETTEAIVGCSGARGRRLLVSSRSSGAFSIASRSECLPLFVWSNALYPPS